MPVQVPGVLQVVEVLRELTAHVAGLLSSSSQDSETEQQEVSEVWTSVASLTQACIIHFSAQTDGMKHIALSLCAACFGTDY